MTTLKALRDRSKSVQSTQKITMAMKMVAGAKLRRAQERVEAGRPYARLMRELLENLAKDIQVGSLHPLLTRRGNVATHLILVATSDQGLCGPFNTSILREARKMIASCQGKGQVVKLFCIGRKGKEALDREYPALSLQAFTDFGTRQLRFPDIQTLANHLIEMFSEGEFDVCTMVYSHFKSAMRQDVVTQQLIPGRIEPADVPNTQPLQAIYTYEPQEDTILDDLLPHNIAVQLYTALLENTASEQGSRMTAMDNASRNAADMLRKLKLDYNRTRQTHITRELIEIISGAEAL